MYKVALSLPTLAFAMLTLTGCGHQPQITIVNRADNTQTASTPFEQGRPLNFPRIDAGGSVYYVIFVDQTPCKPSGESNPKAYKGTPDKPPSCDIDFTPHGQDRLYRYALYKGTMADKAPVPPPFQMPYPDSDRCQPYCNGSN